MSEPDILDDPRYDSTAPVQTIAVTTKSTFNPKAPRRRYLARLGLPNDARWEAAHQRLIVRIANARRRGDEAEAAQWSTIKTILKRQLYRTCRCGNPTRGTQCRTCQSKKNKGNKRGAYVPLIPKTIAVYDWIMARDIFFLDELCWWYQTNHRPTATKPTVQHDVGNVIAHLKRRGILQGGGSANWQRYEVVKSKNPTASHSAGDGEK